MDYDFYGAKPVIVLRGPEDHERMYNCNGCNAPNVTSVLEVGSLRERGGSTYLTRWCGACTRRLKSAVSEFVL